ncbi:MAG: transcriptional regulator, AraC family [Bacteroidetes bacterium]|jgi:AraC-like DNA-binding protein/mannose-6-phosphate isomerase-like protein (cupin superfamily)|nr:transcriptional regulator, AraC family [Bacteroidota bacterium]
MPRSSHTIPLHKQDARAIGGLDVRYFVYTEGHDYPTALPDHRDDYYVLMIVVKGSATMHCDMETIRIRPESILLIKPYQVHSGSGISSHAEAYFISIAPFLMPDNCVAVFRQLSAAQQYLDIPRAHIKNILNTSGLLANAFAETNVHRTFITNGLFTALINRIASLFLDAEKKDQQPKNQAWLITQAFRQLVSDHSFLQPPAFFAEKLNITTSHLNDCVKATTGLSVTNFLQEAMLIEAKRNLYYTNNDVKKIAYTLGFSDHAYFSRLFKKLTKETPLSFRNKFRE